MRTISMEKVQSYFNMLDVNKQLLFNARNLEQERNAREFEQRVLNIINDLVAPLPTAN